MQQRKLILQSGLFSVILHLALLGLLLVSFDFATKPLLPAPGKGREIVKAVTVQNKQVERELQKIKDAENKKLKKQQALEKKLKDLENSAAKVKKQRREEEKRLAEARRKKEQEQKQSKVEQKKLAQLKQQQQELEKQRQIQEQKKKAEEAAKKRKEEAERKRREEEQKRAEEAQKRKAAEEARKKQLAEAQRQREAAQARQDQVLLQSIALEINQAVESNFNISGLPKGLQCELTVRTVPGGEVVNVTVSKSSGNDIFDRRAIAAVEKASPLPLPGDAVTFNRLKLRQFAFVFRPQD